jgi:tRNA dimethylallyltransferase
MTQPIIPILAGPTASGKTALSLELGGRFALEILSSDAMMVYTGMDIGTAKPSPLERNQVPHHLIDLRDPNQDYDVTQFVADAETVMADVLGRKKIPLIVGGTGFYLSALIKGQTTTPKANPELQATLERELAEHGLETLLLEVKKNRPSELIRLERNPRRVIRALELFRSTGKFPSEFPLVAPKFKYQLFALRPDPSDLERRITLRVDQMLQDGLIQEVQELKEKWLPSSGRAPTALQAIGYKETLEFLAENHSLLWLRETLILRTRQYGKRQITWLRTQLKAEFYDLERAKEALEGFLDS